jgi:flagellar hook assembly protein FlgD
MKKFIIFPVLILLLNLFTLLHAQNPQWMHFSGNKNISQMVKDGDNLWLLTSNDLTYFNPNTGGFAFDLKTPAKVQMKIYNIKGQLVKTLCDEKKQAKSYKIEWNGKDENNKSVASGIYFCRIKAGEKSETKKMMLIK